MIHGFNIFIETLKQLMDKKNKNLMIYPKAYCENILLLYTVIGILTL